MSIFNNDSSVPRIWGQILVGTARQSLRVDDLAVTVGVEIRHHAAFGISVPGVEAPGAVEHGSGARLDHQDPALGRQNLQLDVPKQLSADSMTLARRSDTDPPEVPHSVGV